MSFVVITPASLLGGLFTGIWYVTTGINFILLEESLVGQRQILGVVISFAVGVLTHPKMFAVIKLVALGRPIQFFNSHVIKSVLKTPLYVLEHYRVETEMGPLRTVTVRWEMLNCLELFRIQQPFSFPSKGTISTKM